MWWTAALFNINLFEVSFPKETIDKIVVNSQPTVENLLRELQLGGGSIGETLTVLASNGFDVEADFNTSTSTNVTMLPEVAPDLEGLNVTIKLGKFRSSVFLEDGATVLLKGGEFDVETSEVNYIFLRTLLTRPSARPVRFHKQHGTAERKNSKMDRPSAESKQN
jgi:hypothetical protein